MWLAGVEEDGSARREERTFKGCTGCYAELNPNGGNKAVAMGYLYNPNNANYSVSFSPGWVGFSVSGVLRAYSASKLEVVSY